MYRQSCMVEETEYDDVVTCKHSYSEKCHTTYTTDFEPQQEEDCEENFVKSCFIEYKKVASEEAVTFCHTPIILEGDGEEVCQTVYESACTTRYEKHDVTDDVVECETIKEEKCEDVTQGYTTEEKCTFWPVQKCKTSPAKTEKYSPNTDCKKVPREVCGPGTTQVPGEEECFDRKETVIQEVPTETCNLEPQKICKHVHINRIRKKSSHDTWFGKDSVNKINMLTRHDIRYSFLVKRFCKFVYF